MTNKEQYQQTDDIEQDGVEEENTETDKGVNAMTINDFIQSKFTELEEKGSDITEHVEDISDEVREKYETICTNSIVQSRDISEGRTYAIALAYVAESGKVDVFEYKYEIKNEREESQEGDDEDEMEDEVDND